MASLVLIIVLYAVISTTSPAVVGRFDYRLCEERLCIVNEGCSTMLPKGRLVQYSGDGSTDRILITIQLNFLPDDSHLMIMLGAFDHYGGQVYRISMCNPQGDTDIISVPLSDFKTDMVGSSYGSMGAFHFTCEFTISSEHMEGYVPIFQTRHGTEIVRLTYAFDGWLWMPFMQLKEFLAPYKWLCDPSMIQFDKYKEIYRNEGNIRVIANDQLALSCPHLYELVHYDYVDLDFLPVESIKCARIGFERGQPYYGYEVTPLGGIGRTKVYYHNDTALWAHCHPIDMTCPAL